LNISISILTWNRREDTKFLMDSLVYEYESLLKDNNVFINVCDNGSSDGTLEYLQNDCPLSVHVFSMLENKGISVSKNVLIDAAIENGSDFMFMFDNDVSPIKGSLIKMLEFIKVNTDIGCFGQHIDFYNNDKKSDFICKKFPELEFLNISYNVKSGCGAIRAWTHYSIYRMDLFKKGIRFDVSGPFSKRGYGFDDDDLGMQIFNAGYKIACFKDVRCYHNRCSSVEELKRNGELNYSERERYFKGKWINIKE